MSQIAYKTIARNSIKAYRVPSTFFRDHDDYEEFMEAFKKEWVYPYVQL